jgi:hypothetical protein
MIMIMIKDKKINREGLKYNNFYIGLLILKILNIINVFIMSNMFKFKFF